MSLKTRSNGYIKKELLAHGYIRLYVTISIPIEIIQIIVNDILNVEQWDIKHKGQYIKLSGEYNEIIECTHPHPTAHMTYQTILGSLSVDSGKHHWKFRIKNLVDINSYSYRITVGMIKIDELNQDDGWEKALLSGCIASFEGAYGVVINKSNGGSSILHPYSPSALIRLEVCCDLIQDIFDMYLDLDNLKFGFSIAGIYHRDAYYNYGRDEGIKIEKGKYKMAVSLSCKGTALELVSYEEIDQMP